MTINNKDKGEVSGEMLPISTLPPFYLPYFTRQMTQQGTQIVEIQTDRSTRVVMENEISQKDGRLPSRTKPTTSSQQKTTETVRGRASEFEALARGNDRAVMYLEVPYSEKNTVKRMGARWDSAMRKWYVPHGLDINLFTRWWPKTLKHEMKPFGQI